jgi:hypothetical protein
MAVKAAMKLLGFDHAQPWATFVAVVALGEKNKRRAFARSLSPGRHVPGETGNTVLSCTMTVEPVGLMPI